MVIDLLSNLNEVPHYAFGLPVSDFYLICEKGNGKFHVSNSPVDL
jgi:hypothetical protein